VPALDLMDTWIERHRPRRGSATAAWTRLGRNKGDEVNKITGNGHRSRPEAAVFPPPPPPPPKKKKSGLLVTRCRTLSACCAPTPIRGRGGWLGGGLSSVGWSRRHDHPDRAWDAPNRPAAGGTPRCTTARKYWFHAASTSPGRPYRADLSVRGLSRGVALDLWFEGTRRRPDPAAYAVRWSTVFESATRGSQRLESGVDEGYAQARQDSSPMALSAARPSGTGSGRFYRTALRYPLLGRALAPPPPPSRVERPPTWVAT